jgi:hypothetical protein
MRPRLSYANVIATIALFVALGGTGYAAATITGGDVKNSTLSGKDVRDRSLTGKDVRPRTLGRKHFKRGQLPRGPQGLQGPPGPAGTAGAPGAPGADGASGAALLTGIADGITAVSPGITSFRRVTPTGYSTIASFPEQRATLTPGRALVARDLAVRTVNDLPPGAVVTADFVLDNPPFSVDGGEDDILGCTVTGTAGTDDRSCAAPGPVALPPASTIYIRLSIGGGTSVNNDPGQVRWGITVEPAQ